nr:long chain acyl-CoA synthetase 4-like [Tanacetum cinerariifolium]
ETSDSFDLPSKMRSDICTIMYTSGTTGEPKGVLITNESILSILSGVHHRLESMSEEFQVSDMFFSYLPLAHVFDRVIEELFISNGASIGIWRGDIKLLIADLKELKPTVFCAVPRVLDRIYSVKKKSFLLFTLKALSLPGRGLYAIIWPRGFGNHQDSKASLGSVEYITSQLNSKDDYLVEYSHNMLSNMSSQEHQLTRDVRGYVQKLFWKLTRDVRGYVQECVDNVSGCSRGRIDNNILSSNATRKCVCFHPCRSLV